MARYVNSRVTINMHEVRRLTQAAKTAVGMTTEALHTDVVQRQVMPRDTGALQGEKTFVDLSEISQGKAYLVHEGPYARRLYYHPEYNFHQQDWEETINKKDGSVVTIKHGSNPNAKGRWLDDYKAGGKKQNFCKQTFKRIYKRVSGV